MATHLVDQKRATVQTPGATETTLMAYTLLDESLYTITAHVVAKSTGGDAKMFTITGAFKRTGGGGDTTMGSILNVVTPQGDVGAALWAATLDVSGNDVRVRVTGVALTTIDWLCRIIADGLVP